LLRPGGARDGEGNELPRNAHAAMVLDRAGWHVAKGLYVPVNVTLIHLPPKSPELNPTENLWHFPSQSKTAVRIS
jgi:hypothetical protein